MDILYENALALSKADNRDMLHEVFYVNNTTHKHHDNESTMVCLPKKSTTQTPNGTPAFTTNNTRPLNIVNADNRLVASAARNRWEKMLGPWVLDRQQGFLPGRSILRNLLEMDIASMHTALMQDRGACLLLDFASALPSISQDFVFSTLKSIGVPEML